MGLFTNKEDVKKAERKLEDVKYELRITKAKLEKIDKRHARELEEIEDSHEEVVHDLRRKLDKQDRVVREAKEKADEKVAELKEENKILLEAAKSTRELKEERMELDEQVKLQEIKEKAFGDVEATIEELTTKAKESEDSGYKKGYADGVADGLRKGSDLAADERKMAMQIAAISAASHVPEATTAIANEMVKEATRALSAGKTKAKK